MNISSSSSAYALQRPDPQQMREAMFKKTDADGSGSISKDELSTMLANAPKRPGGDSSSATPSVDDLFAKIDTDSNGEISAVENDTAMEAMESQGMPPPPPPPDGAGFAGASDKLSSLLDALSKSDSDDTTTSTTTGTDTSTTTASTTAQEELAKLIEKLAAQLKQEGGSASLFKTTA